MPRVRPRWWTELLMVVVVYGAYSSARLMARGDVHTAVDNGLAILRLESALWLHAEHPLNDLFTEQIWLGLPSSFAYASLHYLVTPAILVWLFRRRPVHYRLMRTWLLGSTLLGLIGFALLPTCPPRLLAPEYGFVDSMAQYAEYGWWAGEASAPSGLGNFTNQYAAMPSLHVGWSVWCGVALWHYGTRSGSRAVRALAVGYPLLTTVVVMGTANHYFLDTVAGVAVMFTGLLLAPLLVRISDRFQMRFLPGRSATRAGQTGQEAAVVPVATGGPHPRDRHEVPGARHNGPGQRHGQLAPPA